MHRNKSKGNWEPPPQIGTRHLVRILATPTALPDYLYLKISRIGEKRTLAEIAGKTNC